MVSRIIGDLEREGTVREICENMRVNKNDIDDFVQEIYMILLEYNKDKIIELYNKKQLRYFIVGIVSRQYNSNTSPFYKKYKKYYQYIDGNYVNNEDVTEDYNYQFED